MSSSGTLTAGSGTTADFANGVLASHSLTLGSTGSTTVTATRTSGGSQSGTSASFTTNPGTMTNSLAGLDHGDGEGRRSPDPLGGDLEPRSRLAREPVAPLQRGGRRVRRHRRRDRHLLHPRRRRPRPDDPRRRDRRRRRPTTTPPRRRHRPPSSPPATSPTPHPSRSPARPRSASSSPAPPRAGTRVPTRAPTSGAAATPPVAAARTSSARPATRTRSTRRTSARRSASSRPLPRRPTTTPPRPPHRPPSSPPATSPTPRRSRSPAPPRSASSLTRSAASWTPGPGLARLPVAALRAAGGGAAPTSPARPATTYTLAAADLGQTIRVVETASKTAYNDATSTSTQTAVIAAGDLTNTTPVSITGTAKVGEVADPLCRRLDARPRLARLPVAPLRRRRRRTAPTSPARHGTTTPLVGGRPRPDHPRRRDRHQDRLQRRDLHLGSDRRRGRGHDREHGRADRLGHADCDLHAHRDGAGAGRRPGRAPRSSGSAATPTAPAVPISPARPRATYVVVSADVGKKLRVRETASKAGYTDASANSGLTAAVSDADSTPPTNTITLGSPVGAYLTGTTLYYRPSAAGSFTLRSAVADSGFGPASATYPRSRAVRLGSHGARPSPPRPAARMSRARSRGPASRRATSPYVVTAADAWSPPNTSQTTLTITAGLDRPLPRARSATARLLGRLVRDLAGARDALRRPTAEQASTSPATRPTAPIRPSSTARRTWARSRSRARARRRSSSARTTASATWSRCRRRSSGSTRSHRTRRSTAARRERRARRTRPSLSAPATARRPSSAACCRPARGAPAPRRRATRPSPTTPTPSRSGPSTRQATPTPRRRRARGRSTRPPADTTITSAPPADTNATGASFSFIASDAGPSFECKLDAGAFGACGSPKTYASLAEGAHTFSVRAVDAAGNADPTPATHAWTVDTTAPDTTIPLTPADPSSDRDADLRLRLEPVAGHVRVQPRRRRLERLPDPAHRQPGTGRRLAHARGARDRCRRQYGRDTGELHLARRRDRADRLADRAGRRQRRRRHRSSSPRARPMSAAAASCTPSSRPRPPARARGRRSASRTRRRRTPSASTRRLSPTVTTTCA